MKVRAKAIVGVLGIVSIALMTSASPSLGVITTPTPSLGLTVSIVPSASGNETPIQAGQKNSIALTVAPGTTGRKTVKIRSASTGKEFISVSIGDANRINGSLTLNDAKISSIATWVTLDRQHALLKPMQVLDLAISIAVPANEPIGIREAYLLVKATDPTATSKGSVSLSGAARYAVPIYLGVGTTTQIVTSFSVGIITLINTTGGLAFAVPLINTGMTPVAPVGFLTLGSVLGQLNFAAQIPFAAGVIQAGDSQVINVLVPAQVPDAVWNVHADVHEGTDHATSDSIVTIKRQGLGASGQIKYYRMILGLISLILFVFVFLYIRRGNREKSRLDAVEVKSDLAEVTLATFQREEERANRKFKNNKGRPAHS